MLLQLIQKVQIWVNLRFIVIKKLQRIWLRLFHKIGAYYVCEKFFIHILLQTLEDFF